MKTKAIPFFAGAAVFAALLPAISQEAPLDAGGDWAVDGEEAAL